jgi:hypothetical protein
MIVGPPAVEETKNMKRQFKTIAATGVLTAVLVGWASARPQQTPEINLPPMNGVVKTERDAYLLLAPEFVAGPKITEVRPSLNHDFLLVVRESRPVTPPLAPLKPPSEVSLILWDMRTRKSTVVWRTAATPEHNVFVDPKWIPGTSDIALVTVMMFDKDGANGEVTGQSRILRVDARTAAIKTLATAAQDEAVVVGWSQPVVALSSEGKGVRLLRLDSGIGRTFPVPPKVFLSSWYEEGKSLTGMRLEKQADGKYQRTYYLLDIQTGQITEQAERFKAPNRSIARPELPPLHIARGSGTLTGQGGVKMDLNPLWLSGVTKDTEGSALLTPDGERPELLRHTALFYSKGALYAAPIEKLDRTAYEKLRREVLRRQAMNNAKQIGIAMMMYAQDYDEMLPTPGGEVRDMINPYLKNDRVFLNPETGQLAFTLVPYSDAALASIKEPANTAMGYLTGPGGRAVVYFDGHVRWEDLPNP